MSLLGTKYTMEQEFQKSKLVANDIEVLSPDNDDRNIINSVIYEELCLGIILDRLKQEFLKIINKLTKRGAQGCYIRMY